MGSADGIRAVLEALEHDFHDPHGVLTALVRLHELLSTSSPSPRTLEVINQRLSHSVQLLHHLLEQYLTTEHELIWHLCQIITLWSRLTPRFAWEAGVLRMWRLLQRSRKLYPESPCILESSLDATVVLFESTELHQFLATRETNDCERVMDELLQLLDVYDSPPARTALLSPHYDFSNIIVRALQALNALFSSTRVAAWLVERRIYTEQVIRRLVALLPHFLKTSHSSRVWLTMAHLQFKYAPQLALTRLFLETTTTSGSWCQQLISRWSDDRGVVHEVTAVFTQLFAVPHGAGEVTTDVANALIHTHGILDMMTSLFKAYTAHAASVDALSVEHERIRPVVYEIARVLRQLTAVPSITLLLSSNTIVKTVFIPHLISECITHIQAIALPSVQQQPNSLLLHWRLRLLLEYFLTLESCLRLPSLVCILPSAPSIHLRSTLARLEKHLVSMDLEDDAAVPSVLFRQSQSLRPFLPSSSSSSTSRRLPSSSRTVSRLRSATSSSSSLTVRRSPSSSTYRPS